MGMKRKRTKSEEKEWQQDAEPTPQGRGWPYKKKEVGYLRGRYYPGQRIKVMTPEENGKPEKNRERKVREYVVAAVYKNHVSCIGKSGFRESFGFVEMEQIRIKK